MRPSAPACGVRLLPQCPRVECPRPLSAKTAAADEARATDWQGLVASQRPARKAGTDRGRVETSNLRDHGVSTRSEASGIAAGALRATAGADGFDRGGFESCAADVLGSSFCAFYRAAREGLMLSSPASAV